MLQAEFAVSETLITRGRNFTRQTLAPENSSAAFDLSIMTWPFEDLSEPLPAQSDHFVFSSVNFVVSFFKFEF
jgi:hypothetical protein